jgi:hypothetical protein
MNNRGNQPKISSGMSFSNWMDSQKSSLLNEDDDIENQGGASWSPNYLFGSTFGQLNLIKDNFSDQFQELAGSVPEAGPLSAAFRQRLMYAVYLLGGSFAFGILAIVIGLPTLIVRPSKFVLCMTLSSTLGASSVVVLQKPSVFLSNLVNGGPSKILPVVLMLGSMFMTIYVTIFIHKYVYVLTMAIIQIGSMFFYVASFIPGGTKGLKIIMKTGYVVVSTAIYPCIFVCKKVSKQFITRLFS